MNTGRAVLVAGVLIAAAVVVAGFAQRYSVVLAPGAALRVDGWSGSVSVCNVALGDVQSGRVAQIDCGPRR